MVDKDDTQCMPNSTDNEAIEQLADEADAHAPDLIDVKHTHYVRERIVTHSTQSDRSDAFPATVQSLRPAYDMSYDRAVECCSCGARRVVTLEKTGQVWMTKWTTESPWTAMNESTQTEGK